MRAELYSIDRQVIFPIMLDGKRIGNISYAIARINRVLALCRAFESKNRSCLNKALKFVNKLNKYFEFSEVYDIGSLEKRVTKKYEVERPKDFDDLIKGLSIVNLDGGMLGREN